MARQDKTRQYKTRQEKDKNQETRQGKTQDKTRQDNTMHKPKDTRHKHKKSMENTKAPKKTQENLTVTDSNEFVRLIKTFLN